MPNSVRQMLRQIQDDVIYTRSITGIDKLSELTVRALTKVPRDYFVPEYLKDMAFENGPLPIGHGQTISQPYIVALMTELLSVKPDHIILEIGTGSGYQSAILSQLCKRIYTVELIPELSHFAEERFQMLRYNNIETRVGNGYYGWPEHAPYDGIIVTAAATHIPETLVKQLKPGGKLVIPVGLQHMHQELLLLEKDQKNKSMVRKVLDVAFVPLVDTVSSSAQSE